MLAVFDKSVAKSPEGLAAAIGESESGEKGFAFGEHFSASNPGAVCIGLGPSGILAYTSQNQNPFHPRSFAVVDDMYCIFQGHISNIGHLKQQYGLNKTATEVTIVIEAYRTLRDRGPYPADQVVRDFHGKFAFVLFDCTSKTTFIAADADGSVPFFWGTNTEEQLIFSDDAEILKKACGKSYAPFPKGCFFTSSRGLTSYEHPLNEVKAMPRVDSQGQVCGSTFKVDSEAKKETAGMPRVGSAADWSGQY